MSRSYWNCRWIGPWDSARMVPSALYSYAASLCPSSCYAPILAKGHPNRKLEWMRRLCHGDTGGAFGLISYKRLHQTDRAGGTLLPLLNEVADREAGTGFPDVFHIKNILALFSGNFTHGDPLVLHTVALNQFDLVLCAVSQHRVCFDLSRQNAFYDREIFPLHTIAPF